LNSKEKSDHEKQEITRDNEDRSDVGKHSQVNNEIVVSLDSVMLKRVVFISKKNKVLI
jgi:predicted nuclease of predicted toxin-antitoxin system